MKAIETFVRMDDETKAYIASQYSAAHSEVGVEEATRSVERELRKIHRSMETFECACILMADSYESLKAYINSPAAVIDDGRNADYGPIRDIMARREWNVFCALYAEHVVLGFMPDGIEGNFHDGEDALEAMTDEQAYLLNVEWGERLRRMMEDMYWELLRGLRRRLDTSMFDDMLILTAEKRGEELRGIAGCDDGLVEWLKRRGLTTEFAYSKMFRGKSARGREAVVVSRLCGHEGGIYEVEGINL